MSSSDRDCIVGIVLVSFGDRFGSVLGSVWDRFGIGLESVWDRFELYCIWYRGIKATGGACMHPAMHDMI